jgi:hypothetical protein
MGDSIQDENEKYLESFLNKNTEKVLDDVKPKTTSYERASELKFITFDIKDLPCGNLYPNGTLLKIKAASVRDIQAYSMVDDNNIFDIIDKANDIIAECVRISRPDGSIGSYLELKDPDRFYLLFVIRDMTFQKGALLQSTIMCECGQKNVISLTRHSFNYYDMDIEIEQYFDDINKHYFFELENNKSYTVGVPTIGLQKSFYNYIIKHAKSKDLNAAFLKIVPFTISDRISITEEGIKKLLIDFENLDEESFQFLNQAVQLLKFGIKEIKCNCSACGEEAHADFSFPDDKPSRLFVKTDAFSANIKKK